MHTTIVLNHPVRLVHDVCLPLDCDARARPRRFILSRLDDMPSDAVCAICGRREPRETNHAHP